MRASVGHQGASRKKKGDSFAEKLAGGNRRKLGPVEKIVSSVLRDQQPFDELFTALTSEDQVVRLRACNTIEKVTRTRPELLAPYAKQVLTLAAACEDTRERWHLLIFIGRLPLRGTQKALAIDILFEALAAEGSLTRTFAMQSLADLAENDAELRRRVMPLIEKLMENGSAAMQARGRILLKKFRRTQRETLERED